MFALYLITTVVFFLGLLNLWLWTRRQLSQPQSNSTRANPRQQLSSEVSALNAGAIGLGERLLKIERGLNALRQRLEQIELNEQGSSTYSQAINLVKRGTTAQELMQICDLSESEAELLIMMHQQHENNNQSAWQPH